MRDEEDELEDQLDDAIRRWGQETPMKKVSMLLNWQIGVAEAVRAIPDDFVEEFRLYKKDLRFRDH